MKGRQLKINESLPTCITKNTKDFWCLLQHVKSVEICQFHLHNKKKAEK